LCAWAASHHATHQPLSISLLPSAPSAQVKIEVEANDLTKSTLWEKGSYLFLNGPTFSDALLQHLATKANGK
jgi:hypothetical protein